MPGTKDVHGSFEQGAQVTIVCIGLGPVENGFIAVLDHIEPAQIQLANCCTQLQQLANCCTHPQLANTPCQFANNTWPTNVGELKTGREVK